MKMNQQKKPVEIQSNKNDLNKNLKIIAVSDMHGQYYSTKHLPQQEGDIIIFAGDFTQYGTDTDFQKFFQFLDSLKKFKHKIVIAGNHEIVMDPNVDAKIRASFAKQYKCRYSRQYIVSQLKKRAIYLEHQYVQVEGLKIFGSPYTQYYCGSAFQVKPPALKVLWNKIPQNLDILITHGPPHEIFDRTDKKTNAGCPLLLEKIKKIKPKIHIFGHIHEGRPYFDQPNYIKAYGTKFYNVAQRPQLIQFFEKQQ